MPLFIVNILAVALGGAIGSSLRYCVSLCFNDTHSIFALSTLTVNILGSFIIGALFVYATIFNMSVALRLFLFVGLLGGFTTFSSFSLEVLNLVKGGAYLPAITYIMLSNCMGIIGAFAGYAIGTKIFRV